VGQCGWLSHRRVSRLSGVPLEEKAVIRRNPIARILALVLTLGLAAPPAVDAQRVEKVFRIGVLAAGIGPAPLGAVPLMSSCKA
jgi:hypothetical protein